MNVADVERLSDALLYEGYILYPYRRSAMKNRCRWNFGALCPRSYSEAQKGTERWQSYAEFLVQGGGGATLQMKLRFLHLAERRPEGADPEMQPGNNVWHEAVPRDVVLSPIELASLSAATPRVLPFEFAESNWNEPALPPVAGAGLTSLRQCSIQGTVSIAGSVDPPLTRVRLTVSNAKYVADAALLSREQAMMHSPVSCHLIVTCDNGRFISLLEPPEDFSAAAAQCSHRGLYPVLVGRPEERDTILISPIILYDYPQIAPESEGDLFDGTEIDEILLLRIMTLTDAEKSEMRSGDDRARAILERIEKDPEQLARLHGTIRERAETPGGRPDGFL